MKFQLKLVKFNVEIVFQEIRIKILFPGSRVARHDRHYFIFKMPPVFSAYVLSNFVIEEPRDAMRKQKTKNSLSEPADPPDPPLIIH